MSVQTADINAAPMMYTDMNLLDPVAVTIQAAMSGAGALVMIPDSWKAIDEPVYRIRVGYCSVYSATLSDPVAA